MPDRADEGRFCRCFTSLPLTLRRCATRSLALPPALARGARAFRRARASGAQAARLHPRKRAREALTRGCDLHRVRLFLLPACGEKVPKGRMRGRVCDSPTANYTIQATTPNATTIPTIPGINRNA